MLCVVVGGGGRGNGGGGGGVTNNTGLSATPGLDRTFVMCKRVFYDECWLDTEEGLPPQPCNRTGSSPEEYTTYVCASFRSRLRAFVRNDADDVYVGGGGCVTVAVFAAVSGSSEAVQHRRRAGETARWRASGDGARRLGGFEGRSGAVDAAARVQVQRVRDAPTAGKRVSE